MSRLFVSSTESMKIAYEKSVKYLLIIGFPVSVGLVALADRIILMIYDDGFTNSIATLQIVGWYFFLISMYRPVLTLLVSVNRQGWMALIAGLGALANVVLNASLIPSLSHIGASIATVATQVLVIFLSWYIAGRYLYRLPMLRLLLKPMVASAVMGGVVYFVSQRTEVNLFLLVAMGVVIYALLAWVLKFFDADDKELFRQVVGKIRLRKESPPVMPE